MSATTILLVDDEPSIQVATATLLRSQGYTVLVAGTGGEAIAAFDRQRPRFVILDLKLPDMDGVVVCRQLRARADVPILILSVRGEERAKVEALDAGADDYVTKPFGVEELLARVRAGLRRTSDDEGAAPHRIERGELVIDLDQRRVLRRGREIRLTPKELELLTMLASHHGTVLTHRKLIAALWGLTGSGQQEHLRVLVGQLRKKIEPDPSSPRLVLTEPWIGYRFAAESADRTR